MKTNLSEWLMSKSTSPITTVTEILTTNEGKCSVCDRPFDGNKVVPQPWGGDGKPALHSWCCECGSVFDRAMNKMVEEQR